MAAIRQVLLSLALVAGAVWLVALYVPSAAPWLDRVGAYAILGIARPDAGGPDAGWPAADAAHRAIAVVTVPVVTAQLTDEIAAIGDGRAFRSVAVRSDVAGRIAEVPVVSGERLDAGAILVRLDDAAERIALERARLTLADAEDEMARVRTLSEAGAVTAVRRRSAELAEKSAHLGVRQAEFELNRTLIRAPIAGWVGLLDLETGNRITNQEVLAVLTDRSRILVDFRVPERLTGQVRPGVEFQAEPLALRGRTLTGRIVAVDNVIDRASRTLRVQGELPNGDDALRAGMAFAVLIRFDGPEHPAVPALAVQWSADGAFVWAVRDARAHRIPVTILRRTADRVLVEGALSAGDEIVVEGVQNLRPGAEVAIRRPLSAASVAAAAAPARL